MPSYCCTCAAPLDAGPAAWPHKPETPEKAPMDRQLPCCGRIVCAQCLLTNARFATYCPYCQIATAPPPQAPSAEKTPARPGAIDLLPPGLKPPPPYSPAASAETAQPPAAAPPPYASTSAVVAAAAATAASAADGKREPLLHYLDHSRDSVASLALRYRISADRLRRANRLAADHLLQARQVVLIPRADDGDDDGNDEHHNIAFSLSPVPVEGEAAARRKTAIRRFMVACKVVDYDVAVLYLEQTAVRRTDNDGPDDDGPDFDLAAAIDAYRADEQWAQTHPMATADAAKKKHSVRGLFFSRRGQQHHKTTST